MTIPALVPIVEGRSEVEGLRRLIERMIYEIMGVTGLQIVTPFLVKRNRVIKEGRLETAILMASISAKEKGRDLGGLLVLLDADDDDPVEMTAALTERARRATQYPVSVVLANKVIECWLLGAKESLRGVHYIHPSAEAPADPESFRHAGGSNGRLGRNMTQGPGYGKTHHLPGFLEVMDIDLCLERCPSFGRFVCEIDWLVSEMKKGPDTKVLSKE